VIAAWLFFVGCAVWGVCGFFVGTRHGYRSGYMRGCIKTAENLARESFFRLAMHGISPSVLLPECDCPVHRVFAAGAKTKGAS